MAGSNGDGELNSVEDWLPIMALKLEEMMGEFLQHFWMEFSDDGTVRIANEPGNEEEAFTGKWTFDGVDLNIVVEGREDEGPTRIYMNDDGFIVIEDENPENESVWTVFLRRAE